MIVSYKSRLADEQITEIWDIFAKMGDSPLKELRLHVSCKAKRGIYWEAIFSNKTIEKTPEEIRGNRLSTGKNNSKSRKR